jgi:hypothetical protein
MWLGGSLAALLGCGLLWTYLGTGNRASARDFTGEPWPMRAPAPQAPATVPVEPPPAPLASELLPEPRSTPAMVPVMPAKAELVAPKELLIQEVPVSHEVKAPVTWVNSRYIRLNYELREVGPSGVSAVELWATRDGKTWQCYANEPPPAGPLVVHVAEEGSYGFTLVVKSGVGTCSQRPKTGDPAQMWVEVDETRPEVKLGEVVVGKGAEADLLTIHWKASDPHLAARPITIKTAVSKDGAWTPIATNLENTGTYVWKMPKDVPFQFHVRVEACDQAGNVGCAGTADPVHVDPAQPKGKILGVDVGGAKY